MTGMQDTTRVESKPDMSGDLDCVGLVKGGGRCVFRLIMYNPTREILFELSEDAAAGLSDQIKHTLGIK